MDWRYRLRLAEIAERERVHLEKNAMQYADLRQAKLNLLEMEEILQQTEFAVQFKGLRQTTLKAFAKDEKLCQAKLTELAERERRHQSKMASLHEKHRQASLAAMDAEERVRQLNLIAHYEKLRQAMQPALAFAKQPPKEETPNILSQSYEKLRSLAPQPIRSAIPNFSSALGMLDGKMTSDINKGLQSNNFGSIGMPVAYNSIRLLFSPAKREEFSKSQYDYDKQYRALNPEMKEHLIDLDRFKNESLGSYQSWRNEEPKRAPRDNGFQTPTIPIYKKF